MVGGAGVLGYSAPFETHLKHQSDYMNTKFYGGAFWDLYYFKYSFHFLLRPCFFVCLFSAFFFLIWHFYRTIAPVKAINTKAEELFITQAN